MEGKLRFVLMLFVVSEASPQPPPPPTYGGQRPPLLFGNFAPPPPHYHGRQLERHRPLPDRPLNIDLPFFNNNNPTNERFNNQRDPPQLDPMSSEKQRMHPRPINREDMNANVNAQFNSKTNDEDSKQSQGHKTLKTSTNTIIARISEELKKDLKHIENITKHRVNTRTRENLLKTSEKIDKSTSNAIKLRTTTTPKTNDIKSYNVVDTKIDSFNNVDSNLLNQIFGSPEDETSTTESTTEYESTTWDEFNRIGAPPAVVASLLG